ncbi:MAG: hypothetical protein H0V21_07880 [Rubrobacter sp.]|nr:hypothetical protein [Rubrobacter sp.]
MKRLASLVALLVTTAILLNSCGTQPGGTQQVGKMQRESKSVDPKNAQFSRAQLKMGAGELTLTGGADQLMEADFSYNVAEWKPKVSYDVSGDEGELILKQGSSDGSGLSGEARNEWDIRLNDEIPTDLVVQMGAGENDLDLDSLTLMGLDLQMGAGKSTVDLTGDYAKGFEASIEGGVGEATVLLPSKVGVMAKAEGGLGKINAEGLKKVGDSYVNDAYGESDVTLNVDVQGGVGEINLEIV